MSRQESGSAHRWRNMSEKLDYIWKNIRGMRDALARRCSNGIPRLLDYCRRLWCRVRATNHLSCSPRHWRTNLRDWLRQSSPETYGRLQEQNTLERHLQHLLEHAYQQYRLLRQQGYSWRRTRQLVEQELANQIGQVPPPVVFTPTTVPAFEGVPETAEEWRTALETTLQKAAPEGYAEAKRRGILHAHLDNVLHWVEDRKRSWSANEQADRRRELFEQACRRVICIDWQTPPLHRDASHWADDLVNHLWRSCPERAKFLESRGELYKRAAHVAQHLRLAWQRYTAHIKPTLADWEAFARAALLWMEHPWHDLLATDRFEALTVDIVGSCNARCPFCPRVAMPAERAKGFMDFDLFCRILEKGRTHAISTLYLYSTGEPTLHPRFDDFVALAKDMGYSVLCSTNGSMMHQRRKGLLLADVVQLSIEGWDRPSYERYRYPLRFDRVYANVREYAGYRPPTQRYVVNCLVTRKTDIEQYAILWGEFFDAIVFHPMYPTAGLLNGRHQAIPQPGLAEDYWWFEPAVLPFCHDPFAKLTIAYDGKRVLCCQDFSASLPLGHADDNWQTLYDNPVVARVRQELWNQTFETCAGCGTLMELPATVKAALLAEIERVWHTHPIRAKPSVSSLQIHHHSLVVQWLCRIASCAAQTMASGGPTEADSTTNGHPSKKVGLSLPIVAESRGGDDILPTQVNGSPALSPPRDNSGSRRRVLLVVGEVAEFLPLAHLAQRLSEQGKWQPTILFTEPYPSLSKHLLRCRQWKLPVWAGPRVLDAHPQPFRFDNQFPADLEPAALNADQQQLLDWCRTLNVPELEHHLQLLRRELACFRFILEQLRPDSLVLGQENVSKYTPVYSRTAHDYGIATVIVPWCLASREEFEKALSAIPLYDATTTAARRFCERFPQWRLTRKVELLRAPVYEAAALEILGCAPADPWAFHSGFASALAVESPWMLRHYQRQGVPHHWLRLTGSWCDDALQAGLAHWQPLREQLCRELHLDPHLPLILAALPSNQMPHRGSFTEFSTYQEVLTYWADTLAALPYCQTILVAHPSTSPALFRCLERPNVRLSDRPTHELVPLTDALVACVSSIIRWALACGLPVIDYDLYRYRYSYFQNEPQVRTVETREAFADALQQLLRELTPGRHVPSDGIRLSDWGLLDGQSTRRIADLLSEFCRNPAATRQAA